MYSFTRRRLSLYCCLERRRLLGHFLHQVIVVQSRGFRVWSDGRSNWRRPGSERGWSSADEHKFLLRSARLPLPEPASEIASRGRQTDAEGWLNAEGESDLPAASADSMDFQTRGSGSCVPRNSTQLRAIESSSATRAEHSGQVLRWLRCSTPRPSSISTRLSRNSRQFIQLSPSLCCLRLLPLHSLAVSRSIRYPHAGLSRLPLLTWLRLPRLRISRPFRLFAS